MHRWNVPRVLHGRNLAKIVGVSLLLSGALASPAAAGTDWCDNDPVVAIPGHTATVITRFKSEYKSTLSGALHYEILVRRSIAGVTSVDTRDAIVPTVASVVAVNDDQWRDLYGKADFAVRLYVGSTDKFEALTEVAEVDVQRPHELTRAGKSNTWIEFTYRFKDKDGKDKD